MTEIWKPIPGYDRYEISNMGRVRSFAWSYKATIPRLLKLIENDRGYVYFRIKQKHFRLNRMVLIVFVGDEPLLDASHIDSDKHNNKLDNLIWESGIDNRSRMQYNR